MLSPSCGKLWDVTLQFQLIFSCGCKTSHFSLIELFRYLIFSHFLLHIPVRWSGSQCLQSIGQYVGILKILINNHVNLSNVH